MSVNLKDLSQISQFICGFRRKFTILKSIKCGNVACAASKFTKSVKLSPKGGKFRTNSLVLRAKTHKIALESDKFSCKSQRPGEKQCDRKRMKICAEGSRWGAKSAFPLPKSNKFAPQRLEQDTKRVK